MRKKTEHQEARWKSSWSVREAVVIRLWAIVWFLLAAWTPKCFRIWRVFLLWLFGAKIKGKPFVFSSARIYAPFNVTFEKASCVGPRVEIYSLGKVHLGCRCVISQETFLCGGSHDLSSSRLPLTIGDIEIGDDVFIGARAMILPGVSIGRGAVVGAGAVVAKDVSDWKIVAGNPAKEIGVRILRED